MSRAEKKELHVKALVLLAGVDVIKDTFGATDPEYVRQESLCRMEEYDDIMSKLNSGAEVQPPIYY